MVKQGVSRRPARRRVLNPPQLVPDPNGPMVKEILSPLGRLVAIKRFRYDPEGASMQVSSVRHRGRAGRRRRR